jgi:ATP-dependent DNA helicase RecG
MRQEVKAGHRVFIVCPTIEESDTLGIRAVTAEHERLGRDVFPDLKLGLLHGKLPARSKTSAMAQFAKGETPILVTTSVIEVGVDVPEATVMAVESAERFGLSQLHQFRGRVGRSELPSYCLLLSESENPHSLERLNALTRYHNGFDLAEFDLKQRGAGDIMGELQSGWGSLRFASLADQNLLKVVQQGVALVLSQDSSLNSWPELKTRLDHLHFHPE